MTAAVTVKEGRGGDEEYVLGMTMIVETAINKNDDYDDEDDDARRGGACL